MELTAWYYMVYLVPVAFAAVVLALPVSRPSAANTCGLRPHWLVAAAVLAATFGCIGMGVEVIILALGGRQVIIPGLFIALWAGEFAIAFYVYGRWYAGLRERREAQALSAFKEKIALETDAMMDMFEGLSGVARRLVTLTPIIDDCANASEGATDAAIALGDSHRRIIEERNAKGE